jgi:hypothetical protein
MNTTRILALGVILFSCWAAYGGETEEQHVQVLGYKCDTRGITEIVIHVDSPGTAHIAWSNQSACGTPV